MKMLLYVAHRREPVYFPFFFTVKSWNKDSRTEPKPLFLADNPLGPSPILCHRVTLSSLAEFASIASRSVFS